MTLAEFRDLLSSRECKPTGQGMIAAKCPAHEDGRASLSVSAGADGRVIVHCHAGCAPEAIVGALGLKLSDLFADKPHRNGHGKFNVVASYNYLDEGGNLLFQVCRMDPKDFRQRAPDGKWSTKGIRRVPFRLPELLAARNGFGFVFVTEGEKDALALVAAGFDATCNPGGAGKWLPDFASYFDGAQVVVIADKDEPGRKHAQAVATSLHGNAGCVRVIELPDVDGRPVKDAADFFAAGGQPADLDEIVNEAPFWKPPATEPDHENNWHDNGAADEYGLRDEPTQAIELPPWVSADELCSAPPETPPELIHGVLHKGSKLVIGGGSKTNKTWIFIDLAISVASADPWLSFKTTPGRVLYVNLELPAWSIAPRITAIAKAKGVDVPANLIVWNLRGRSAAYDILIPLIIERARAEGFALIIIDPIYKILGNLKENEAGDMSRLLNSVERLTTETHAAVAFAAHFSKGNQAGKESIDRISGSGVFARDPDSILVMTKHEEDDAFSVEATLRNLQPIKAFAVRWKYPLMRRDDDLDPTKLKQARTGRPSSYTVKQIVDALGSRRMTATEWYKKATADTGVSRAKFYDLLKVAIAAVMVRKDKISDEYEAIPESPESHS